MTSILLISPPLFDFYTTPARKEPLGLLYLKKSLENCGDVSVEIYDTLASGSKKKIGFPTCFNYLKSLYLEDQSSFSLFSNFYRFGDSFQKILTRIEGNNYDLIGITALFSGYLPDVESLIKAIKSVSPIPVILGGWAIDAEKKEYLINSKADYFLKGYAIDSFPLFIQAIKGNGRIEDVPGLLFRKNNRLQQNPRVNEPPIPEFFPDRPRPYFFNRKRIARVTLSKGCPNRCSFCTIHQHTSFSVRSLKSIEDELTYLVSAGIQIVNFEDDNLFYDKDFAVPFLDLLSHFHAKGLEFTAMNGITASNIQSYAKRLVSSGFIELNISLVTSQDTLIKRYNRPFDRCVLQKIMSSIGGRIKTIVFLILGLPGDNPENFLQDILYLAKLPVIIGLSPLYLLPGVRLFENMGIPKERRLLRGSALYKFDPLFSRENCASLWKFVRMINYLKSTSHEISPNFKENLHYFNRSIREKTWYRLTKKKTWERGFSFTVDLPKNFSITTLDGITHSIQTLYHTGEVKG